MLWIVAILNDALRKSKNVSPFTMSVVKSRALIPVEDDIAAMALIFLPLVNGTMKNKYCVLFLACYIDRL